MLRVTTVSPTAIVRWDGENMNPVVMLMVWLAPAGADDWAGDAAWVGAAVGPGVPCVLGWGAALGEPAGAAGAGGPGLGAAVVAARTALGAAEAAWERGDEAPETARVPCPAGAGLPASGAELPTEGRALAACGAPASAVAGLTWAATGADVPQAAPSTSTATSAASGSDRPALDHGVTGACQRSSSGARLLG
ncbi:MAG: hypothetical protein NVS3B26_14480 [Mycobacteriales bacterium]